MFRGERASGRDRKVAGWVAVGLIVAVVAMASIRFTHPLFPERHEAACTVTSGPDRHTVRRGPDFFTATTDCGVFEARNEVTCAADPSRAVALVAGVTYDLTVRGPRIPVFSNPTVVAAEVSATQEVPPPPEPEFGDDAVYDDVEKLLEQSSPEHLRAWDYEQPPYSPACDAYRTLMTSEGLRLMSHAQADDALRAPEGITPRDPRLPCVGWSCDRP